MHCSKYLALAFASCAVCLPQFDYSSNEGNDTSTDAHEYPNPNVNDWAEGWVNEYPIHNSCNSSETEFLRRGFHEAEVLAAHARDHILRWGNDSSYFRRYFGDGGSAEPAGWYNKIVNGYKGNVLFRCDNPDGNCALDGWAGHWRGENASDETVICPLTYTDRWPLASLCMYGYTVSDPDISYASYFASDLLHRLFHMPPIGEGLTEHYADGYPDILQLAIDHPEEAVRNSQGLCMFALDVYAYDISVPGQGCTGTPAEYGAYYEEETEATPSSSSSSLAASSTTTAARECHTHADGEVHCT